MQENKKGVIRLGFAPTRRVLCTPKAFNKDEALRVKNEIQSELEKYPKLELVTLDGINDEGLLYEVDDAAKAASVWGPTSESFSPSKASFPFSCLP